MTYDDRIRLNILSSDESLAVCDDDEYLIKADRLTSLFRLPSRVTWYDGLIDTGAMMTVLPQSIWSQHESAINWVKAPDNQQFPDWLCKVSGLTGGGFNCRVESSPSNFAMSIFAAFHPQTFSLNVPKIMDI